MLLAFLGSVYLISRALRPASRQMRFTTQLLVVAALLFVVASGIVNAAVIRTAALAPVSSEAILSSNVLQSAASAATVDSFASAPEPLLAAVAGLVALNAPVPASESLCTAAAAAAKAPVSVQSLAAAAAVSAALGCKTPAVSAAGPSAAADKLIAAALVSDNFVDVYAALSTLLSAKLPGAKIAAYTGAADAFSLIADLVMPDGTTRASATSIASSVASTGLAAQVVFPLVQAMASAAPASAAAAKTALAKALPAAASLAASQSAAMPDTAAVLSGLLAAGVTADAAALAQLAASVSSAQHARGALALGSVASAAAALAAAGPAASAAVVVFVSRSLAPDAAALTVTVTDILGKKVAADKVTVSLNSDAAADLTPTPVAVGANGAAAIPALASAPAGALRATVKMTVGGHDVTVTRRLVKTAAVTAASASVYLSDKKAEAGSVVGDKATAAKWGQGFAAPLKANAGAAKYLRADVSIDVSALAPSVAAPVAALRLVPKAHPARAAVFPLPRKQGKYAAAYALALPTVQVRFYQQMKSFSYILFLNDQNFCFIKIAFVSLSNNMISLVYCLLSCLFCSLSCLATASTLRSSTSLALPSPPPRLHPGSSARLPLRGCPLTLPPSAAPPPRPTRLCLAT